MNDDNHLNNKFFSHYNTMEHLHAAQDIENIGRNHTNSIHKYTGDSSSLNNSLVNGLYPADAHDLNSNTPHNTQIHNTILEMAAGVPEPFHVYTGSHANFAEMAKSSKNKIVHLPAHVSTSLSKDMAGKFGSNVSRINVLPKDRTLAIGKISSLPREHEVIVPAGTRLKYTHTDDDGIHHFDIHSQVKVPTHKDLGKSIDDTISQISKNPAARQLGYLHRFINDRQLIPHFDEDRVHSLSQTISRHSESPTDILTISNTPSMLGKINPKRLVSSALDSRNPVEAAFAIKHKHGAIPDKDLEKLHDYAKSNLRTYARIIPDDIKHPVDVKRYKSHILDSNYDDIDKHLVGNVFSRAAEINPAATRELASNDTVQRSIARISTNHPVHSSIKELDSETRNHLYHGIITNPNISTGNKNEFAAEHQLYDTDPKIDLADALAKHAPEYMAARSPHVNELLPKLLNSEHKNAVLLAALDNSHLDTPRLIQQHAHDFSYDVISRMNPAVHHAAINNETLTPSTRVKLMSHHNVNASHLTSNSIDTYLTHFDKRSNDHGSLAIAENLKYLTDSQKTSFIEKTKHDSHIQTMAIKDSSELKIEHLDQLAKNNPKHLGHIFGHLGHSIPDEFFEKHLNSEHAQGSPFLSSAHLDKIVKTGSITNDRIFEHPEFSSQHIDHIAAGGTLKNKEALVLSNKGLNKDQVGALHRSGVPLASFFNSGRKYDSDNIRVLYGKSKTDPIMHKQARSKLSFQPNTPADVLKDILKLPNSVNSHDYACTHANLDDEGINYAIENGHREISKRYGLSHSQISKIIDRFPEEETGENKRVIHHLSYSSEHNITPEHIDQILDKHPSAPELALNYADRLKDTHLEKIITNPKSGLKTAYKAIQSPKASHNLINKLVMGQIGVHGSSIPSDIRETRIIAASHINFNGTHLSNLLADHANTDATLIKHAINENPSVLDRSHIRAAKARHDSGELLGHMRIAKEDLF